jgi:hypothetical protein
MTSDRGPEPLPSVDADDVEALDGTDEWLSTEDGGLRK